MKQAIAKKTDTQIITLAMPGDQLDAAGRINYFHRLSKEAGVIAVRAALEVGMILFQEKMNRRGTFEMWIDQNCEFSRATCYRYLTLLQKSIGAQADLNELTDSSTDKREEAIEKYAATVESKTLTEIMVDYGIITRSKSNLGGRREGAGRKRKDAGEAAAAEAAAESVEFKVEGTASALTELYRAGVTDQGFEAMNARTLQGAVNLLSDILKSAKDTLAAKEQATR